ncbi:Zn-ribbon domain-containing OB-fold protein [Bordetella genomosp. 12]
MQNSSNSTHTAGDETIGPEQYFQRMLEQGQFMIQRCEATGRAVFYPRAISPYGGGRLRWEAASGGGTIYSTTVVRQRPERGGDYSVVLVDLDEGPRMMSTVIDMDPQAVSIGMRVRAQVRRQPSGVPRVVFVRAD